MANLYEERIAERIVDWIREQVKGARASGVVFGMSGGVDSSVAAVLCKRAFPESCLALMLPCNSAKKDLQDAKSVAKKFKIPFKAVDLGAAFKRVSSGLGKAGKGFDGNDKIALANIKPRLRMLSLYYFANKLNYLVVGTDNKTEATVGYFTKFGDGGVDILPLADLFKRDVKKLAAYLGINKSIIEKPPSAGLWPGQTDEGEMGITYEQLDDILEKIERGDTADIDPKLMRKVSAMIAASEHKRKLAPACRLNGGKE